MSLKVNIGSRGSPLALWQANWVKSQLEEHHGELIEVDIKIIKTSGDKIQDVPLAKIGGKGLFVKEIEEALIREEVDIAVHSMKDVPMKLPLNLVIGVITKRETPFDAFISRTGTKLADLPENARIGTGSLRRSAQLLKYRPDLEIVPLRGNIDTRLKKLETENMDGIILAGAGLKRMGWEDQITELIDPEIILPAMGQGAVGIEARRYSPDLLGAILPLDDDETHLALEAERAMVGKLEGGCQIPIGAYATLDGRTLKLRGLVASLDGKTVYQAEKEGPCDQARIIGIEVANELLEMGAGKILQELSLS
jgi:hydroxymethylbilane synthase